MKSHSNQLDLPLRSQAIVLPFPAARMIGELREAMNEILALPSDQRNAEISLRAGLVWYRFVSCGVVCAEAKRQQAAYRAALIAAIDRFQVVEFLYGRSGER